MMPAHDAACPHAIHQIAFGLHDPRDGSGHTHLLRFSHATRRQALASLLRWAFSRDMPITPKVAADVTRAMWQEGYVTREEVAEAWRTAHAEHLRQCERETAELAARDAVHAAYVYGNPVYGDPNESSEQQADAGREGAAPTSGLPSAEGGQGSAGIEARARWSRRARFFLRGLRAIGQGVAVGGAIAWLINSLRLWGN